jgi:hypothetical protein
MIRNISNFSQLPAGNATASEHADVSGGGEQENGCQEEAHGSGGVLIGVVEGPDAERDNGDGSAGADEKCREVKPAYAPPTTGEPRRGDHVEGDDAADDVAMLLAENTKRSKKSQALGITEEP